MKFRYVSTKNNIWKNIYNDNVEIIQDDDDDANGECVEKRCFRSEDSVSMDGSLNDVDRDDSGEWKLGIRNGKYERRSVGKIRKRAEENSSGKLFRRISSVEIPKPRYFFTIQECKTHLQTQMYKNVSTVKILKEIKKQNTDGCSVLNGGIAFEECRPSLRAVAYYDYPDQQIVMCCNRLTPETALRTQLHELIHAFDACRFGSYWKLCRTRACSEIRAYHAEGVCNEVYWSHQDYGECVRNHAIASVEMHCPDTAIEDVEAVFESCFSDHLPFVENPNHEVFRPEFLPMHERHEGTPVFIP